MPNDAQTAFDPITLEIYWNRLISIADEAATGLLRTAFSTIVRESNDYATVLMDRNGDSLSENTGGLASFSCILPKTTKVFLQKFPAETWRPGDAVVTNDPWLATGHLPDFTVVTPIFHRDRLVGFSGSIAHSPDVGGSLWSADCRELFEEGIRILPSQLLRAGAWNEDLVDLLLANVRVPRQVLGDLQAQVVANEVCARGVDEFLNDTGLADLQSLSAALHERADRAMRRAILAVPDGTYHATIEADGYDEQHTRIVCTVRVDGETMHIDYTGTSGQIDRGINCVLNYTHAYSVYPVKCALDPFTPRNEGSYRAITVSAPERSILNPVYPAPCSARQLTGHLLAGAIYQALSPVLPKQIIAECGGAPTMRALFSGTNRDGDRFSQVLFASGGMGALPHRDGMAATAFPTNVGAGSIEAYESVAPLLVWKKRLRTDSGGPGTFRGGLGQEVEIELRTEGPARLSLLSDRHQHPAAGVLGGMSGAPSVITLDDGSKPHPKSRSSVNPGQLTTPDDPSAAIIAGITRLLREVGMQPAELHSVVHGTTLVANTIIERTGATVGLLTTEGFRDSIEIGRETRYDLYDLFLDPPPTLVPRYRRLEIPERISTDGEILLALDEVAVARAARQLVDHDGCDALAIAFMHAYRAPAHEQRAAAIVRTLYPDLPLSLSAEVAPEIREFERTSTACANAYVQPLMQRYLDQLETSLAEIGFAGRLYVMLSGGGITTLREAKAFPIRLIESGPAAGAMAAAFLAKLTNLDRVVSFDMGGTTAKMCLVEDGAPDHKFDFEAGRVRRFQKGSGLPLKVSVVDMIEIGAGGGSLAHVDAASGLMKVGPRSAGADPGPVCYGRGGTQPAVTDADLLLGRLDPEYFLGGEMALDPDRVRRAFAETISPRIGVDAETAALGVQRIVDEMMAAATRMHLAEKGKDPGKYTLIAFGGAGPVHAHNLARLLKMAKVVVPLGAGVASALGFLVAPPATDMVTSYVTRLERADWRHINALFTEMRDRGRALLTEAGADPARIAYRPSAEMRHVGQGFEIPVPLPGLDLSPDDLPGIRAAFFDTYRLRFGRIMEQAPIEVLSWRLGCIAPGPDIRLGGAGPADSTDLDAARRGSRKVLFESQGWQDCAVYDRYKLPIGAQFAGPALIEERESTCVVGPDAVVSVDAIRNLVVELR